MSSSPSVLWSKGQREAYLLLSQVVDLFFWADYRQFTLGITPRLTPLLVAQSGMGKSHVIKHLANERRLAYLRLTPSNWVVNGVKDITPTLLRVHRFISDHDQGIIIHLDELDKWRVGTSDWAFFAQHELFDLLDRCPSQPAKNVEWKPDILRRLREDVLIIGTGTWQHLWTEALRAKVGFGVQDDATAVVANVRRLIEVSNGVPAEIRQRFNQELLILPPPTEEDFREAAAKMGITRLADQIQMPIDFALAARSGLGCRWLEEKMGQLLLQAQQVRPDLLPPRAYVPEITPEAEEEIPDFGIDDEQVL
jgi:hypothetical protein